MIEKYVLTLIPSVPCFRKQTQFINTFIHLVIIFRAKRVELINVYIEFIIEKAFQP